jgi:hypothetical protein
VGKLVQPTLQTMKNKFISSAKSYTRAKHGLMTIGSAKIASSSIWSASEGEGVDAIGVVIYNQHPQQGSARYAN